MQVIRHENVVYVDVDSTLVMHINFAANDNYLKYVALKVVDPINSDKTILVRRNEPMLRLLEEEHHRGSFIVVHSRGGYEWAENVIKALGYNHWDKLLIMSKPLAYFDDKPVQEWLPYRVYIGPDEIYKNKG